MITDPTFQDYITLYIHLHNTEEIGSYTVPNKLLSIFKYPKIFSPWKHLSTVIFRIGETQSTQLSHEQTNKNKQWVIQKHPLKYIY